MNGRNVIPVGGRARVVVADPEPPKLGYFRLRVSRVGVLYLSRATSLCPVRTVITCRGALGWEVVAGCTHERGLVPVEVSSWAWWSQHRGRNRRVGEPVVFTGVIDQLRASPGVPDIGVDSLATQLVINRRLPHGANTVAAGFSGLHQHGVYRLRVGASDEQSDGFAGIPVSSTRPERGLNDRFLCLAVAARIKNLHS